MSIAFVHFFSSSSFQKLTDVVFSTCIRVSGGGCTISVNATHIGMDVVPFSLEPHSSVSLAEPLTFHKIFTRTYTSVFTFHFFLVCTLICTKMLPPDLLLAFGTDMYDP